jgi:hypothetical protein
MGDEIELLRVQSKYDEGLGFIEFDDEKTAYFVVKRSPLLKTVINKFVKDKRCKQISERMFACEKSPP